MDALPWIILIIAGILVVGGILIYNGLVRFRNQVDEAWNQISVQLKRRHDLIPNLVNAVKGYMQFEQATLTKVIEARNAAVTAAGQGAAQSAGAENLLSGLLRQLFALVENYPQLKANENVLGLQEELTTTENQIGFARQHYNSVVRDLNIAIQTFPNVLLAGVLGFKERDYFQIEVADTAVPAVDLTV